MIPEWKRHGWFKRGLMTTETDVPDCPGCDSSRTIEYWDYDGEQDYDTYWCLDCNETF